MKGVEKKGWDDHSSQIRALVYTGVKTKKGRIRYPSEL